MFYGEVKMKMCYVDESGDTGPFDQQERNSQPIFLLCGLLMDQSDLEDMTRDIINLKQTHFPAYAQSATHWHDWLKVEVKGASLRRALREGRRDTMRQSPKSSRPRPRLGSPIPKVVIEVRPRPMTRRAVAST